ncbi:vacuolar protein sorting/targeting protein PEP1 [Puccinia graminis f. sp. tritici]|uniref:Vacuolar protein sorting/targeting protein 10 n=2 Tax=Puccinia graminis f. sp. tritici TaxID=56615 RepID=E3L285_PUCGT|nr:uncharacterized protein PGTG_16686 [Puccinia graminis f. sp. tritici CRL 75-36-700-3]EFP90660.1 hypothetical protein PGTG_16686 [Puccinia graminis f. sp. tritici CRL 75-36-700-3]KAA1108132.1 vacuolar protein sorting/targeting protein PEP1 [Puccinia graminis f. sp. tritici]
MEYFKSHPPASQGTSIRLTPATTKTTKTKASKSERPLKTSCFYSRHQSLTTPAYRPYSLLKSTINLSIILLLIFSNLILTPNALKDPSSTITKFKHMPSKLIYFEDTPIILSHDSILREVWRSTDEGKTWNLISAVPTGDAWLVVEHSWDNRVAFILSRGSKHWRTINRGDSWQSFTTSDQPSISGSPLAFHSTKWNWILFSGQKCESLGSWKGKLCYDETWVTSDAFETQPKMMVQHSTKCMWAYSNKHFSSSVPEQMIYCITKEAPGDQSDSKSLKSTSASLLDRLKALAGQMVNDRESRLYSSKDYFVKDRQYVDLGLGKNGRGVVGMGAVQRYIVVALKPGNIFSEAIDGQTSSDEMLLFVTSDGLNWARANFPHGHGLKENAYTIVESTPHSIMVDVLTNPAAGAGTMFTSDSNGTHFIKSLEYTSRSTSGIVDFEKIVSIEGISIANTVLNVDEVEGSKEHKKVQTKITFDDGGHWSLVRAPSVDAHGEKFHCDVSDIQSCALHLHSVTQPHNFGRVFSTPSPGILMGIGNVGEHLLSYVECDTFLSIDGGLNWKMVKEGARKYEIGDQGGLLVMIDDEENTEEIDYSFDFGKTWSTYNFKQKLRVKLLTSVPDATSQKFLLLGTIPKKSLPSSSKADRQAVVQLDFSQMDRKKCKDSDFENWYARKLDGHPDCLMGHKQFFKRRKPDADCYVGEKFQEPESHEENCPCTDEDFECDYNYAPDNGLCILSAPETIPAGQCANPNDKFLGSSGYRLIPGNTCNRATGLKKDEPKLKDCTEGKAAPGQVTHQRFQFPGLVLEQVYFEDSHTVLVFTSENQVWQSKNQGYSWDEPVKNVKFISLQIHPYSRDRAYLIAPDRTIYYTTDKGSSWNNLRTPLEANLLGIPLLDFHPTRPDWLIWTGSEGCIESQGEHCKAVAYYSKDNGRYWNKIDDYVRVCSWGRDKKFKADERLIFCQAYQHKRGSQKAMDDNPLQLIEGRKFYDEKKRLFDSIVGFATFEEFMVVAQIAPNGEHLNLYASMDGSHFALAQFPPNLKIENKAYTVLESTTDAVFLHVTTNGQAGSEFGSLFKSNSNGTYYSLSLDHVNRNSKGYVDFEKMMGLDGIAVMNIVSNPDEAVVTRQKKLVTRITHNDGGRWKPIAPPAKDSLGQPFTCSSTACALHIHGYTERVDPRATYSSPSAVGLMMAVGNVGHSLAPYKESDTFLTRDGGFTWEEVAKDAHMWEYGDQGSILVLVNDEGPTDRVKYTLDEGLTWSEYVFGDTPIRVTSILTVPDDTSRKFILFGFTKRSGETTVVIHLDFSKITNVKCVLDTTDPNHDDFELWSPSETRTEPCLFGRQTLYYRRVRSPSRLCYVGEKLPQPHKIQRNCLCSEEDFECEFNYRRDPNTHKCVLVPGALPLVSEPNCAWNESFWHERTEFRKIPYSSCEGGIQLDKGRQHICPNASRHGVFWWGTVVVAPAILFGLGGFWWMRRRASGDGGGWRRGVIHLPDGGRRPGGGTGVSEILDTIASIPWFLVGVGSALWGYLITSPLVTKWVGGGRQGYRQVSLDDDAELLQDYED